MDYWTNKVAVVTGASSGLGLAIAAALAAAGAKVVIAARGVEALEQAAGRLRAQGREVLAVPTDVTDQAAVEALFAQTIERFGRLDILVNNAGRSMRRKIADSTVEDFQSQLDLNLLAVVRCTRAALPHLLATRGHLVNIGSLSGKTATPYMGAYPTSKFAVTAYTQQLRLELGASGLQVLLVCPGPIARDEPRARTSEELASVPASALKPGAGAKTRAVSPERIASDILDACQRGKPELVYPHSARILFALMQLSPRLGDFILRRFI